MNNRPLLVIAGSVVAVLFGLVGLVSGFFGFGRPLNTIDGVLAWPSLIVGLLCLAGAVGFWSLKVWGEYVYIVAFAGHVVTQIWLYVGRGGGGRAVPPTTILFLLAVPVVSLAVVLDMEYHRRKGVLN